MRHIWAIEAKVKGKWVPYFGGLFEKRAEARAKLRKLKIEAPTVLYLKDRYVRTNREMRFRVKKYVPERG